jgi:hypothetical protein
MQRSRERYCNFNSNNSSIKLLLDEFFRKIVLLAPLRDQKISDGIEDDRGPILKMKLLKDQVLH